MKYLNFLIVILTVCLLTVYTVHAEPENTVKDDETKMEEESLPECPHWGFKTKWEHCKDCHVVPSMLIKKEKPYSEYWLSTPSSTTVEDYEGELVLRYTLDAISHQDIKNLFDYAKFHKFNHIVMEIHSPGGSLFDAQRIIGMMKNFSHDGGKVTTIVYGFAASAGFLIAISGDERLTSPLAQWMWHELYTFKFFDISGPSDKEDEARVLRHLQDTVNTWVAERSNLSKDELDLKVRKKELWANGEQAVEMGFADRLIDYNALKIEQKED